MHGQARADDGIFGYTYPPPELKEAVVDYLARVHNWKVSDLLPSSFTITCLKLHCPLDRVGAAKKCMGHDIQVDPSWIVFLHGLVPGLVVASRMAGSEGDEVMVSRPSARCLATMVSKWSKTCSSPVLRPDVPEPRLSNVPLCRSTRPCTRRSCGRRARRGCVCCRCPCGSTRRGRTG